METLLRQRMRGSFQLLFEDKPLCVPRQLSVEEVCADVGAMLHHDWRRLGISAEEVREFCLGCNAPTRAELAGRPCGHLRPGAEGAPHRVLPGLRRALLHVQGREALPERDQSL